MFLMIIVFYFFFVKAPVNKFISDTRLYVVVFDFMYFLSFIVVSRISILPSSTYFFKKAEKTKA